MAKVLQALQALSLGAIQVYRYCLSPWVGYHCRFYPTCSQYALTAIGEHGAVKGWFLSLKRLCRCHPWGGGGVDPVPTRHHPEDHDKGCDSV